MAHGQISFDLFNFSWGQSKGYKNLRTFSDVCGHSSGNLYHYPEFNARTHGLKFSNELYHNLSRKLAWEAVFRIRLSHGFQQTTSYGNIQIKNKTADLILAPTIDSDRTFMYEFEKCPDDASKDNMGRIGRISKNFVFIQSALLYSTSEGQRRIRCHNVAVPLCNNVSDAYEYLDVTAATCILARKSLNKFKTLPNTEATRSVIEAALNNMCRANQRHTRLERGQQFQFSDNMQYFIMYVLGLLKSKVISIPMIVNQIDTVDRLSYQRFMVNTMTPEELIPLFSPQIISISNRDLNDQEYPPLEQL